MISQHTGLFYDQASLVVKFDTSRGETIDDSIVISDNVEVPFVVKDTTSDIDGCGVVASDITFAVDHSTVTSDKCTLFDVGTSRAGDGDVGTSAVDMYAAVVGDSHGEVAEDIDTVTATDDEVRGVTTYGTVADKYHGVGDRRTSGRTAGHCGFFYGRNGDDRVGGINTDWRSLVVIDTGTDDVFTIDRVEVGKRFYYLFGYFVEDTRPKALPCRHQFGDGTSSLKLLL